MFCAEKNGETSLNYPCNPSYQHTRDRIYAQTTEWRLVYLFRSGMSRLQSILEPKQQLLLSFDGSYTGFNPLYNGKLFHCYMLMLDEPICHFRGIGTILSLLF